MIIIQTVLQCSTSVLFSQLECILVISANTVWSSHIYSHDTICPLPVVCNSSNELGGGGGEMNFPQELLTSGECESLINVHLNAAQCSAASNVPP